MNFTLTHQLYFLAASAVLLATVGFIHLRNSKRYLAFKFRDSDGPTKPINGLQFMGFLLPNIAAIGLFLNSMADPYNQSRATEALWTNISAFALILGITHFLNLLLLTRFNKQ